MAKSLGRTCEDAQVQANMIKQSLEIRISAELDWRTRARLERPSDRQVRPLSPDNKFANGWMGRATKIERLELFQSMLAFARYITNTTACPLESVGFCSTSFDKIHKTQNHQRLERGTQLWFSNTRPVHSKESFQQQITINHPT